MSSRVFDHALLLRFLVEVRDFPRPVAEQTIEIMRLDGNGLWLEYVLTECRQWQRQEMNETTTKED